MRRLFVLLLSLVMVFSISPAHAVEAKDVTWVKGSMTGKTRSDEVRNGKIGVWSTMFWRSGAIKKKNKEYVGYVQPLRMAFRYGDTRDYPCTGLEAFLSQGIEKVHFKTTVYDRFGKTWKVRNHTLDCTEDGWDIQRIKFMRKHTPVFKIGGGGSPYWVTDYEVVIRNGGNYEGRMRGTMKWLNIGVRSIR